MGTRGRGLPVGVAIGLSVILTGVSMVKHAVNRFT